MIGKIIKLNFVFTFVFILFNIATYAAPINNHPHTIEQPDGSVIDCFMSGDEYFNYIHDENGYLIKKDEKTGYYVYVGFVDGEIVTSTGDIVTNSSSESDLSANASNRITVNDLPKAYFENQHNKVLTEADLQAHPDNENKNTIPDNRYYKQLFGYDTKQLYESFYDELLSEINFKNNYEITFENADLVDTPANRKVILKKVKTALSAFLADYPQVFWVNTFDYSFNLFTGTDNKTYIYSTTLYIKRIDNGKLPENTFRKYIIDLDEVSTNIAEAINADNYNLYEPYEKVRAIFTTLGSMYTSVDNTTDNSNKSNASGVLLHQNANSYGVASAFKLLCDKAGIECLYAEGYAGDYSGAYNLVKLDGMWYLCDVANNKLMTSVPDNYLLLNPSRYGDSENNVQIFTYPNISDNNYLRLGDVNSNGIITERDAEWVMQYCSNLGTTKLTYKQKLNADVNGDGDVTKEDADLILQMTKG